MSFTLLVLSVFTTYIEQTEKPVKNKKFKIMYNLLLSVDAADIVSS